MTRMFVLGGPFAALIALVAVVALAVSLKKAFDLFIRNGPGPEGRSVGLDAILFCGCISAALGLLGQVSGVYLSSMIISKAGGIKPQLVAEGLAAAMVPPVFGLTVLVLTGIVWFVLKCRRGSLISRTGAV